MQTFNVAVEDMRAKILSICSQPTDIGESAMHLYLATLKRLKVNTNELQQLERQMEFSLYRTLSREDEAGCPGNPVIVLSTE